MVRKRCLFFERDIYQAINWCARARQYNNWSVIEALIDVENLIDLTLTEHYDKVDKLFEILEDKFENDINRSKKLTRKELFDILYSINQYDGIRSYFKVPKGGCIGKKVASHIKRVHVQLCVRNHDCIICFEEVDKGEY
ncbi:hypothetical protein [Halonatronum saccharophilum]|uniref:hypothetical protein n=1 Tax=Halonatronum saccharophilum TaxID=150060 RepID=UPI00047F9DC6|nr:hypothetical protein [Halonatronum saccharophilum]